MITVGNCTLYLGDCRDVLKTIADGSMDAVVTDPPYELGFMGRDWDRSGVANDVAVWAECLRVLKPGGHLLAFSGARTYHRMACAIEDAGFELRDQIMWIYGSGFPKSKNLDGDWAGWGTALKPAHEPICVARKPLVGTVAVNVLEHGTGALNIDACRISYENDPADPARNPLYRKTAGYANGNHSDCHSSSFSMKDGSGERNPNNLGRWPANVIHDGSDEVLAAFPDAPGQLADASTKPDRRKTQNTYGALRAGRAGEASANRRYTNAGGTNFAATPGVRRLDTGSAARFFYCAKASRADRNDGVGGSDEPAVETNATMREREIADWSARNGNHHPTVKPTELMAYLCRLVTPPGGIVLDPFMGSGSTGKACIREGFGFVGIDLTPEYVEIGRARIEHELVRRAAEAAERDRQPDLFQEPA
ncbi:DNA-methyltransferase [Burkholderia glumae]|uniref:DNA-methyltransferase n=1 Tax=Burkholderia glumae TaxID=337 RepID=UPI0020CB9FB3|nr:site-specific DNA-methyltransferase [Burkholderia glumae]MCQ0032558.1 site-specific DNA-methyltransferase [Burkholderia glumae]MCQ0035804.1 site-specific DNA-methyltransferase [Burkholderia glumae]